MNDHAGKDAVEQASSPAKWRRWMDRLALLVMLPSLLAVTARWWWIGDLCCHFRVPYAIALTLLVIVYAIQRRWRWLASVSILLAINVGLLWPILASRTTANVSSQPLRLLAANVFVGNPHAQPVLDLIREVDPDLVLLMEIGDGWQDDLQHLQESYPYQFQVHREEKLFGLGPFAMVLFSRLPLTDVQSHQLGTAQTPMITAQVSHAGQELSVFCVHPLSPVTPSRAEARDTFLTDLARIVYEADGPKIVVGDMNITRWSPKFSELLQSGGLRDSEEGFGYQPTWPDWLPWAILPIDHVLVSPNVVILDRRIGPSTGSDHRPLIVDLAIDSSSAETDVRPQ